MGNFSKLKRYAQDAYTAEDDFWKIFTWLGEKTRLEKSLSEIPNHKGLAIGEDIIQVLDNGNTRNLGKFNEDWLEKSFGAIWNSYGCNDKDQKHRVKGNWSFMDLSLPYYSTTWVYHASIAASNAKKDLSSFLVESNNWDFINDQLFTSHLARLSVMLADHHYSAKSKVTEDWRAENYRVYANTYRASESEFGHGFKQQLDEHLIGVAFHAGQIAKALPKLNGSLKSLENSAFLSDPVTEKDKEKSKLDEIIRECMLLPEQVQVQPPKFLYLKSPATS